MFFVNLVASFAALGLGEKLFKGRNLSQVVHHQWLKVQQAAQNIVDKIVEVRDALHYRTIVTPWGSSASTWYDAGGSAKAISDYALYISCPLHPSGNRGGPEWKVYVEFLHISPTHVDKKNDFVLFL